MVSRAACGSRTEDAHCIFTDAGGCLVNGDGVWHGGASFGGGIGRRTTSVVARSALWAHAQNTHMTVDFVELQAPGAPRRD